MTVMTDAASVAFPAGLLAGSWSQTRENEFLVVLSSSQLETYERPDLHLQDGSIIVATASMTSLTSVLDKHITIESFLNAICAKYHCHLRHISSICSYLTVDGGCTLVVSLVMSTLDYCSALLAGQPRAPIARLQHFQNWAAHLVIQLLRHSHIPHVLVDLHWPLVQDRVKFKLMANVQGTQWICAIVHYVLAAEPAEPLSASVACPSLLPWPKTS